MSRIYNRFRFLFENMVQGAIFLDDTGKIISANPAAARILGTGMDRLKGKIFFNQSWKPIHEDGSDFPHETHPGEIARRTGRESQAIMGIYHSGEAEYRWLSIRSIPVFGPGDDAPAEILTTFEDVTEYRMSGEAERKGGEQYRILTENMQDVVWILDPETLYFRYVSPSVRRLKGYEPEEVMALPMDGFMAREEAKNAVHLIRERTKSFLEAGGAHDVFYTDEMLDARKDGSQVWTEVVTKYYLNAESGKPEIQGVTRDVSERKKAEAALQKSLEEKDVLMRELQHRVKNNFNVINSLLSLESARLTDDRSKDIFLNAQTRIQAMSGIYERLYSSHALDRLDLHEYVEEFTGSLHELYSVDPDKVEFEMDLDELEIDLKRAVPLCLVLNELVTNALKYAYPEDGGGKLFIALKKRAGNVELLVKDAGAGLPSDVDPATTESMGFTLVRNLSEQLGGIVTVSSAPGKGTGVKLVFPF